MHSSQGSSSAPVELAADPDWRCGMKPIVIMIGAVLGLLVITGIVDTLARIEWVGIAAVLFIIASLVAVMVVNIVSIVRDLR